MTQNTQDNWREDFRNKFYSKEHGFGYSQVPQPTAATQSVEDFISTLLTSQFQSLYEEVDEMSKVDKKLTTHEQTWYHNAGYNQAISDMKSIIRNKMEK